jgi:hypothetical protein
MIARGDETAGPAKLMIAAPRIGSGVVGVRRHGGFHPYAAAARSPRMRCRLVPYLVHLYKVSDDGLPGGRCRASSKALRAIGSSASATSPATATAWVSIVRRFANGFGNRFRTGFSITSAASPQPRGDANAFIGAQFMTELGESRYRESNKVYFAGVRIRACTHKS